MRNLILFLFGSLMVMAFYNELKPVVTNTAYFLAGVFGVSAVVATLLGGWYLLEKMRLIRAARIAAEKDANVLVVANNNGTWVREMDKKAIWRNLTLDPRIYANGKPSQPTEFEVRAWTIFNGPKRVNANTELLPALTQPISLLNALDNVQRCLIVGASDSGKTTLLQHIITRRLHTSKVVIIDPHAYPNKWPGAKVIGAGRNYAEIDQTLTALIQVMSKRYDDIGKGITPEMGHPKITILIDEWRAIVANVKPAGEAIKALLTESRKAAFTVFVATHSDRAKPLGLEGEYDLKDGFAIVRLSIVDGQRQATIDTGNGELPAILPGAFNGHTPQLLDGDDMINLEVEPTPAEAFILELHKRGENISNIAAQVYGNKGGNQNEKVKDVLNRYGVIV